MEIYSNNLLETPQKCPSSKSYANRALFLASLKEPGVTIKNLPVSEDVTFFINALKSLGLDIVQKNDSITFNSTFSNTNPSNNKVFLGEGGTTIRFITVLLASLGGEYKLEVESRFLKRPIEDLKEVLLKGGVKLEIKNNIINISGKLDPAFEYEVDCSKTTQVGSAFLMLEKLKRVSKANLINLKSSQKYVEMTNAISFKNDYVVPVDFSSLSYFVVWALHMQDILIKNVGEIDNLQADSKLFNILDELNVSYLINKDGLKITKTDISGSLEIDCSECLDLVPSLAFLFAYSQGSFTLKRLENLRYKESNRLEEIIKTLEVFNISHELDGDTLVIHGAKDNLTNKTNINCSFDHRIVMMNALFLKYNNGGELNSSSAVDKSFGNFFKIFN